MHIVDNFFPNLLKESSARDALAGIVGGANNCTVSLPAEIQRWLI